MRDLLPTETAIRDWATQVILQTYEQFGFTRIETPALEHLHLLKSGEGGENLQLIFEVMKRGDKLDKALAKQPLDRSDLADLGLRFDLTVPLVRYFCNNQNELMYPLKAIQIGSVWRAESPQQGRFRQFTQCDIDVLGIKSEIVEMELLTASSRAMLALGFENFSIRINDRRLLSALVDASGLGANPESVFIAIDKLDKIGMEGVKNELLKAGRDRDAVDQLVSTLADLAPDKDLAAQEKSLEKYRSLIESNESLSTSLKEPALGAIQPLLNVIRSVSESSKSLFDIVFDPTLVRGMGYYTGQIFEISVPGYSYSMGGGGRYDRMVGKFSGRDVPACGYSIGFERVIGALMDKGFTIPQEREKLALIYEDRDSPDQVMEASNRLREQGFTVATQPKKKDMKKQLDSLVALNFSKFVSFRGDPNILEIKELKK